MPERHTASVQSGTLGNLNHPATFKVLPAAQGEIIEYGAVAGANSLASAMGALLSQVDQACGEKPSVGQVFAVRGTTSVAVFFTVVDHAQANRQLAGLVIAVQAGSNDFEAGLVADTSNRFAQTANPMMQQLFSAVDPGRCFRLAQAARRARVRMRRPRWGRRYMVTAPDNSASVSVPAGWTVDPVSFDGGIILHGANGELLGLNLSKEAVDPTNAFQKKMAAAHVTQAVDLQNAMFYAYRGDPAKEFAPFMQAWLKSDGMGSTQLQVQDRAGDAGVTERPLRQRVGTAHSEWRRRGRLQRRYLRADPNQYGYYTVVVSLALVPVFAG